MWDYTGIQLAEMSDRRKYLSHPWYMIGPVCQVWQYLVSEKIFWTVWPWLIDFLHAYAFNCYLDPDYKAMETYFSKLAILDYIILIHLGLHQAVRK